MASPILTSLTIVGVWGLVSSTADAENPTMPVQTLDVTEVAEGSGDEYGLYPNAWVTTPLEPVVIRQNHPDGPTYQEALG